MLNRNNGKQEKFIVTTLEQLMPEKHFLRDLSKYVCFDFIYEKVEHLYSGLGRRSVDPVVLIKMLLLGFLYGINSERKLVQEIEVNLAFRWFLCIDLDETVPDHSTISQTRRRKWKGTHIFEDIFTEIVKQCIEVGLVDGSLILTDSTHVKANASNGRREVVTVTVEPREYIKRLEELCEEEDLKVRAERSARGLKRCGRKPVKAPKTREVDKSPVDPDCGILNRPGKPAGFHYLVHQSTEGKSGIITDVFVTPANVEDFEPYAERIRRQISTYRLPISEVGIDSAYDKEEIHKEMYDLGIKTYTPLLDAEKQRHSNVYPMSAFRFDDEENIYVCPNGCSLKYSHVNISRRRKIYRASQKDCKSCPLRVNCIGASANSRELSVSFFAEEVNCQRSNFGTKRYYEVQRRRRILCEGNFALQKDNHNLRRTRKRGNENVTEHCLFSALALNINRLVKYLKSKDSPDKTRRFLHNYRKCSSLFQKAGRGFEIIKPSSFSRPQKNLCKRE